jgi:hypothetical protein
MANQPSPKHSFTLEQALYGKFVAEPGGPAVEDSEYGYIQRSDGFPEDCKPIEDIFLRNDGALVSIDEEARESGATFVCFADSGLFAAKVRFPSEGGNAAPKARRFTLARVIFLRGCRDFAHVPTGFFIDLLGDLPVDPPVLGDPAQIEPRHRPLLDAEDAINRYLEDSTQTDRDRLGWLVENYHIAPPAETLQWPFPDRADWADRRRRVGLELHMAALLWQTDGATPRFTLAFDAVLPTDHRGLAFSARGPSQVEWQGSSHIPERLKGILPKAEPTAGVEAYHWPRMAVGQTTRRIARDPFPLD